MHIMDTKTRNTILAAVLLVAFAGAALAAGATLETAVGKVIVKLSAETPQRDANAGMALPVGAVVATGATGRAVIRFNATDTVRLGSSTQLKIVRHDTTPGSSSITLLKLLVGSVRSRLTRPAAVKSLNFGVQAGQAVCAVKGTDFEATGQKGVDPVFTCYTGLLVVGRVAADGNLENAFNNLASKGGRSVAAGFMVTATGLMPKAVPAPVLKSLEIVSGKVTVVENGQKVTKGPGEVVEPGTKVSVGEGGVLLAGSKMAVEGAEGSDFTLSSKPDSKGTVSLVVTVGGNSQMVTVDTGAELVPIDPGTSLQVAAKPGEEPPIVTQVRNPTAAEIAASAPKPIVVAAAPKPAPELDTTTGEVKEVAAAPAPKPAATKPKAPAPAPTTTTEEPSYSFGQLAFFSEPSLPPPPPDTTNQDVMVVSPIGPQ